MWSKSFPHVVDGLEKESDETFLALVSGKLHRISASTGENLLSLDTGFENAINKHFSIMADEYCFIFSQAQKLVHIVELASFKIKKTLNLTDRKEVLIEKGLTKIGRSVYFCMNASGFQKLIFEINLDTLDLTFEEEPQPDLNISIPTEGYEPITIETDGEYIGDLIRYLDFTALEIAEREGDVGRGLGSNKHFNGVILVTCLNTDADGFNLDDSFRRLKYAIEKETASWGMRCGKGITPITFEYQFEV